MLRSSSIAIDESAGFERRAVSRSRHIVVAVDHRDDGGRQAEFQGEGTDAPRSPGRIGRSEVADDADAVPQAARQHGSQHVDEQWLVTAVGVLPPRELREREGALGECLEDQERRSASRNERIDDANRRIGAVAGEAGRASDSEDIHSANLGRWG